jgi:hypothetical protein
MPAYTTPKEYHLVGFRVDFFTEKGFRFAHFTTNDKGEAEALQRKMKNGYAKITPVV